MQEKVEGAFEKEKSPKASSSKMGENGKGKREGDTTTKPSSKKERKKCEPTCAAEVRRWKQVGSVILWRKCCDWPTMARLREFRLGHLYTNREQTKK